ncbi:hypothetical protein N7510_000964 [Penicillium lagena]|uniref:uncharacterized protein n=1 Tax=Penicillium lagena TaxID=94218 RepID=UPI00253FA17B|nr:uncharacterized protein N7510_000964 [Penicillium lagena]KAJ5624655.1 hypothetical protein N7510_000964 [Penicillium lagena]
MSGRNPFRPKNDNHPPPNNPDASSPLPMPSSSKPNGVPITARSLEIEADDSTSSGEQANPFHPDYTSSDDDEDTSHGDDNHDRPRQSFGSAPPPAPSGPDGSSTPSSMAPFTSADRSRTTTKDKKPPPPPRSVHGKRITTGDHSRAASNRLSFHASSPEALPSSRASGSSHPNTSDYFAGEASETLQRSRSAQKRPPTPPLSRRQSQMRRSKSTQSKSSTGRLNLSSADSESNSSLPPSPGPPSRSLTSSSSPQDRKRISMPPPALGDYTSTEGVFSQSRPPPPTTSSSSSTTATAFQQGRRASSYGTLPAGSPSSAPPPPPPRRARDSTLRSSENRASTVEEPLPQPSNAQDILADLSRLQKEVDDLRGHYESSSRRVSE